MNNSERDSYLIETNNRIGMVLNKLSKIESMIDRYIFQKDDNTKSEIVQLRNDVRDQGRVLNRIRKAFDNGQ